MSTGDPPICSKCQMYVFRPHHDCDDWNVFETYTILPMKEESKMSDFKLGFILRQKVTNSALRKAITAFEKVSNMICTRAEQGYSDFEITANSLELYSDEAVNLLVAKLEGEELTVSKSVREVNPTWIGGAAGAGFIGMGGAILGTHVSAKETYISIRW